MGLQRNEPGAGDGDRPHADRAGIALEIARLRTIEERERFRLGIIAAHGERIWVESQVGVGSVFSFTLPLAAAARPELPPHASAS